MPQWIARWKAPLCAVSLGLYLSRLLAESVGGPWGRLELLLLLVVSMGLSALLTSWAQRNLDSVDPFLWLLLYVLYPRVAPLFAYSVLLVSVISLIWQNWKRSLTVSPWVWDVLLFFSSMGLYIHTLRPAVLPADSGEFQLVSAVLGIAHPPGYPLYTLLGKAFALLPLGNVAWRVNLLSAVVSALTLVLVGHFVRKSGGSIWAGLIAVLALAAAPTFWAQATTANIRSLTALFVAAQLYTLFCYGQHKDRKFLYGFALAFGLGLTHHGSLAFLGLPYAVYLWLVDHKLLWQWRRWVGPLVVFFACFLIWLYLPIRSLMGAPFDPAPIRSWTGFWDHVLARGFQGDMFAFLDLRSLAARLPVLGNILLWQFGGLMLTLAVVGFGYLIWRRWRLGLLLGGLVGVNAFLAITYRAPQTVEYLMPAYIGLIALTGLGAAALLCYVKPRWLAPALFALFLAIGLQRFSDHYPSYLQQSRERAVREQSEALLRQAPPDALILSNWHRATPLWYLQQVEGIREDIDVVYVYPEGDTPMGEVWRRRLSEAIPHRPVIVTNDYAAFESLPYRFLPFHEAQLVRAEPPSKLPAGFQPLNVVLEEKIRFLGYQLASERVTSGEQVILRLAWQVMAPLEEDYSVFVHLVEQPGTAPLAQGDAFHPTQEYEVGRIVVDEFRMSLLPTVEGGRYTLLGGAYFTFPKGWQRLQIVPGQDTATLAQVAVVGSADAPVTTHPLHLSFASEVRCVGVDYDTSVSDLVRVYLHWWREESHTPLEAWLFRDGQPVARGAIPLSAAYSTLALDVSRTLDASWQLEVRHATEDRPIPLLGPWHYPLEGQVPLPTPCSEERHLVLGGKMVLESADWELKEALRLDVNLAFSGLDPLMHDYSVSTTLIAPDGSVIAQDDSTPALGAIPTLKWIRGSRIMDPHQLAIPAEASLEGATIRLAAYNAFTLEPLSIADERLARLGQGTFVVLGSVRQSP